jgi:hypothetical protein
VLVQMPLPSRVLPSVWLPCACVRRRRRDGSNNGRGLRGHRPSARR